MSPFIPCRKGAMAQIRHHNNNSRLRFEINTCIAWTVSGNFKFGLCCPNVEVRLKLFYAPYRDNALKCTQWTRKLVIVGVAFNIFLQYKK